MTTHSMDEAETLCRRMGIMVNGEFVCLGTAQHIKDKYGYGFEIDLRIMPYSEEKFSELIGSCGIEKNQIATKENAEEILTKIGRGKYYEQLDDKKIGRQILREMIQTENMNIFVLCAWTHYVCQAMKVIRQVKEHFEDIILTEFIENNFLFKIKKTPDSKSIGFLFGLVEKLRDKCFITEYSIQPTSLEQIFNMFAADQGKDKDDKDYFDEKVEINIDDGILNDLIYE